MTIDPNEPYCRETMTPVSLNKMRPGYDCKCKGCLAWVVVNGDPMKRVERDSRW